MLKFPEDFKWGSATSAHQVEGNNHNDWTEWEKSSERIAQLKKEGKDPSDFISGKACDSYNRYEEDFDIAQKLNQNIHRFSIEWSRIEPEEGKFDEGEMERYKRLIDALRERGIEPMVTLWHFTNPIWFAEKGGWLNRKAPGYFTRYTKYVVDNLKDRVGLWITFNEATTVYASLSYLKGEWPLQHKNIFEFFRVRKNFIKAHTLAYREIKKIYGVSPTLKNDSSMSHNVAVGLVENNVYFSSGNLLKVLGVVKILNWLQTCAWSKTLSYSDFLGLNYYTDYKMFGSKESDDGPAPEMPPWRIYPKGIYHRLMELKRFKKPIYITENGIADRTDQLREKFIKEHLYWVWKAIQDGADVRGYMYWSLLDNFEWAKGFKPRFGLIEVDYATLERKIRPSAYEYGKICKTNQLKIDL
ncbi:MAG: glycoside hydrolase family 1 protein [Candidatus Yanofskybacteria bacterium]|nr:glycoside hydrolase family 1 protein [Candidatus Yanofskybacteria bacterium]